jgi:hypothetical protein
MTGKRSGNSSRWESSQGGTKRNRRGARDEESHNGGSTTVSSHQDSILSSDDDEERSDDEEERFQRGRTSRRGGEGSVSERNGEHSGSREMNVDERSRGRGGREDVAINSTPPTRFPVVNDSNIVTVPRDDSTRQTEGPRLDNSLLDATSVGNWDLTIKNRVRNEVFYMKQFAKENSGYGSYLQKLLCTQARVPVEVQARYWDSSGRKAAKTSLNEKRKTVIGSMKKAFLSKFLCRRVDMI